MRYLRFSQGRKNASLIIRTRLLSERMIAPCIVRKKEREKGRTKSDFHLPPLAYYLFPCSLSLSHSLSYLLQKDSKYFSPATFMWKKEWRKEHTKAFYFQSTSHQTWMIPFLYKTWHITLSLFKSFHSLHLPFIQYPIHSIHRQTNIYGQSCVIIFSLTLIS